MTASNANIWTGPTGTLPVVNSQGQIYEEVQVATAGQTVFTIATFNYAPGTKTITVFKNGVRLRRAVDYVETDATHVTLAAGAALNDIITFSAFAVSQILTPLQNNGVIPAGTTGQVLAKSSNSDYALQWLNLSSIATLLDQPTQAIASAPTVDVTPYSATTRNLLITGTTQIDGWAITSGQVFLVKFSASLTLSNNVNQVTPTGAAIKIGPNDSCLVRATSANVVEILLFSKSTASIPPIYNDHRLSVNSLQPVPQNDNASSTLYYTAYRGSNLSLYNGSAWVVRQFSEISLAIAGLIVNRPYDVFVYDNAGVPTLELTAWASALIRNISLNRQDGVPVKSTDPTRRFVGTIAPTSANIISDSKRQRLVWNTYNRVRRAVSVVETTASWPYTISAYRQVNANGNNQIEVVSGAFEDNVEIQATSSVTNTAAGVVTVTGVGLNTSIANSAAVAGRVDIPLANVYASATAKYTDVSQLGYNVYVWVEYSGATGATTWAGTANASSGMTGSVMA